MINETTPVLGNLKPYGQYTMNNIHDIGGTPAIIKYLIQEDINVNKNNDGQTLKQTIDHLNIPNLKKNQDIIRLAIIPLKMDISELWNLCPQGAAGKIIVQKEIILRTR